MGDAGKTLVVVVTVKSDVSRVLGSELLHHLLNVSHTLIARAHGLSGVVGVAARAVPVFEELGGEGDGDVVVLSDALENITRHMELVTNGNSDAWADLVLPLTWHDLSIGSRDLDAGIQTS